MQEQQSYGAYTGNQSYQPPYYDGSSEAQGTSTPPQNTMYDDAFIDSLSLRISQRMAQGPVGKVNVQSQRQVPTRATAGQRLALAIVSLGIFFVVVMSLVQSVSSFVALIAIGFTVLVCIAVNIIFNLFI